MEVITKTKGIIKIDLYALSVSDIRKLLDVKQKAHEGDAILGKAVNLSIDELLEMSYPDYRKLTRAFWQLVNDPLKDEDEVKNSRSESI